MNETQTAINSIVVSSPQMDQFYLVSTWVVGVVGLLLVVVLFYLVLVLRDASYVTRKARETSDLVNEYVRRPVGMMMRVISSMEGVTELVMDQVKRFNTIKKKKGKK